MLVQLRNYRLNRQAFNMFAKNIERDRAEVDPPGKNAF
jgi:hypothetical protein